MRDVFKSRLEKSRLGTQELHSASGGLAAAKERYTKQEEDDAKPSKPSTARTHSTWIWMKN